MVSSLHFDLRYAVIYKCLYMCHCITTPYVRIIASPSSKSCLISSSDIHAILSHSDAVETRIDGQKGAQYHMAGHLCLIPWNETSSVLIRRETFSSYRCLVK